MVTKYEKVFNLMKRNSGMIMLDDPELSKILGPTIYRFPAYFNEIRNRKHIEIVPIKQGKRAVGYRIEETTIET